MQTTHTNGSLPSERNTPTRGAMPVSTHESHTAIGSAPRVIHPAHGYHFPSVSHSLVLHPMQQRCTSPLFSFHRKPSRCYEGAEAGVHIEDKTLARIQRWGNATRTSSPSFNHGRSPTGRVKIKCREICTSPKQNKTAQNSPTGSPTRARVSLRYSHIEYKWREGTINPKPRLSATP